jgi:hypothetical protein
MENKYTNGTFFNIIKVQDDFLNQEFIFYGQISYWKSLYRIFSNFIKYDKIKDLNKITVKLSLIKLIISMFFMDYRKGIVLLSSIINEISMKGVFK